MNTRNREIKKARMTRYFIDAIQALTQVRPLASITLRDVAQQAGFNSATLYNYFKNMDQLIAFAIFDLISEMWIEDTRREETLSDPLDQYLSLWDVQCRIAFDHAHLFLAFFMMEDKQPVYQAGADYFAVFGDRFEKIGPRFRAQLEETSFEKKNRNYLFPCVQAGYFREADQTELIKSVDILFGGILLQVLRRPNQSDHAESMTSCFFDHLYRIMKPFLQKESTFQPWNAAAKSALFKR